jgi:hypothetical protein
MLASSHAGLALHHLATGPDPLNEQSQPSHHTAPDVDGRSTATFTDLLQQPAAGSHTSYWSVSSPNSET